MAEHQPVLRIHIIMSLYFTITCCNSIWSHQYGNWYAQLLDGWKEIYALPQVCRMCMKRDLLKTSLFTDLSRYLAPYKENIWNPLSLY